MARSFREVGSGDGPAIAAQPDSPRLPGGRGQRASIRADPVPAAGRLSGWQAMGCSVNHKPRTAQVRCRTALDAN